MYLCYFKTLVILCYFETFVICILWLYYISSNLIGIFTYFPLLNLLITYFPKPKNQLHISPS
ncbi:hypothetical protein HanRHA438_Chr11g0487711 [Helianthus annuus]|nr:hypothetical protein HanRHA438_Chr11g0487711 [Helianthus annuus]